MNRSRIAGSIALLLISLVVFLGCPTGGSTDPEPDDNNGQGGTGGNGNGGGGGGGPGTPPGGSSKTPQELAAELATKLDATVSGVTVTLNGNLTVGDSASSISRAVERVSSLDIPTGVILVVPVTYTLTVAPTGIVTVQPSATLKTVGTATVSGEITVKNTGSLLVETTTEAGFTVSGKVSVDSGASLAVSGSKVTVSGTIAVSGNVAIEANVEVAVASGGTIALASTGKLETASSITGEGKITGEDGAAVTTKGESVTITAKTDGLPPVLKSETLSYADNGILTVTFTFDSATSGATTSTGWGAPTTASNVVTVVATTAFTGTQALKLTVTNSDNKSTTLDRVYPGSAAPAAGEYTIVSYSGGDTVTLKDKDGKAALYYIGGTSPSGLKTLIDTIYAPNAPNSAADTVESGKTAVAYTAANKAAVSDKVLSLFKIVVPESGDTLKVEIKGTDLPATDTGASATNLIVIDIGKPGVENKDLPIFSIPDRALGASNGNGSYGHIRLRVNKGASLVIQADNSAYISGGAGKPCPPGYFNNGCVEVMDGGKLRDGAYEGFPLGGGGAVIVNRYGSTLAVGPEPESADATNTTNSTNTTYTTYYAGDLLGPSADSDGPRVVWDTTGNNANSYLEVRLGEIATNAKLTVKSLLGLIYSVWFVDNGGFTVSAGATLAANGLDYKFYGNSSTTITLAKKADSNSSTLDKRFLDTGATGDFPGETNALVGGDSADKTIRLKASPASATLKAYASGTTSPQITGYCDWDYNSGSGS